MTAKLSVKSMLLQFRIAELQTLLETFGDTDLKLRKKELQKKAQILLGKKRSGPVARKIVQLHKSMNSSREEASCRRMVSSNLCNKRSHNFPKYVGYDDGFYSADAYSDAHYSDYKPADPLSVSQSTPYPSTFNNLDKERIKNIKFPNLPFFEHISDIMLVTPLIPRTETGCLFEFKNTFTLNPVAYRSLFPCDNTNSNYESMLRICLLNESLEVEDSLPSKLFVSINGEFCSCVPETNTNKSDSSGKRAGAPMNITTYLERNFTLHKLVINWAAAYHMTFAATIQLVKKRSTDELIAKLIEKGEQDPSVSKKFIYKNLSDEDNEIAATSLKMSLICPLGKMLMSLPTRGTTCNHLQCFDGRLFIKMNEIKSTWQCPVCSQTCLYENLFVDGYFMDILRSEKFKPDIKDVRLNADGSWESVDHESNKRRKIFEPPSEVPEKEAKIVNEENCEDILSECSNEIQGSFVDDLREIFSNFVDFNDSRSQYPNFSNCNMFDDNLQNEMNEVATNLDTELSNRRMECPSVSKKKVILVDLTISDSESDDVKSTSSSSSSSPSHISDCTVNELLPSNSSPPVYDLTDSDGP